MKKIIIVLIVVAVVSMFALTAEREPQIEPGSTLVVDLDGAYVESARPNLLSRLLGDRATPFLDLRSQLKLAERDERLANVVLRIRAPQLGWAQAQELRGLVADLRTAGRHTIAYLETQSFVSNVIYYIATSANEIHASPASSVGVIGLSAEYMFLGEPLKELGIGFDVARVGRYKSYAEMMQRSSMSDAHREQANSLLDSINDQFIAGIGSGRGLTSAFTQQVIDTAPMSPKDLEALGFIDGVGFFDDVVQAAGGERVDANVYARVNPATVGFAPVSKFALIYGSGNLVVGKGRATSTGSQVMASETVSEAFEDAAANPEIDAIIFRINSPGGSALASDLVWQAIERAKTHGKPVIASMVNFAASGGYYVAGAADAIVASPSTITGSIGVIVVRPVIRELLDKLDIGFEVLSRAKHADMFTISAPLDSDSRSRLEEQVRNVYQLFIERVGSGRGMSAEQVDAVGRGRVWTGAQGAGNGLVDATGGLSEAIALAKGRVGLDADADVELMLFPPPQSLSQQIAEEIDQVAIRAFGGPLIREKVSEMVPGLLRQLHSWLEASAWEAPMLLPPFVVEIR